MFFISGFVPLDIFPKVELPDPRVHEKALSNLLIREIPIKTTVNDHLTPVRMATIQKIRDNKCLEKREPLCPVGGIIINWYSCYGRSSENGMTHLIHKMF